MGGTACEENMGLAFGGHSMMIQNRRSKVNSEVCPQTSTFVLHARSFAEKSVIEGSGGVIGYSLFVTRCSLVVPRDSLSVTRCSFVVVRDP